MVGFTQREVFFWLTADGFCKSDLKWKRWDQGHAQVKNPIWKSAMVHYSHRLTHISLLVSSGCMFDRLTCRGQHILRPRFTKSVFVVCSRTPMVFFSIWLQKALHSWARMSENQEEQKIRQIWNLRFRWALQTELWIITTNVWLLDDDFLVGLWYPPTKSLPFSSWFKNTTNQIANWFFKTR